MDHHQATQLTAVEKYLLDELPPEVRDEFEEHFFDCQECATDLRATAGFIDAAKREFKVKPAAVAAGKSRLVSIWPSAKTKPGAMYSRRADRPSLQDLP